MKIFISYARLNMTTAEALVRDLHALGHQAFYDQDLTGGQRWWDTLLDQIQAADVFIPVLSDEYRESQACRVEAEWADSLHVSFLPVFTEAQLPGMYDPIIAEANWVGYDEEDRDALADLARGVSSVTRRTPPEPLPPRPAIPLSYLVMMEREIRGEDELGRHRQLAIVSDLRSKLGTRESSGARELLQALRERPDVTFEVATTVDGLLASPNPVEPETLSTAVSTEPSNLTTPAPVPVTAAPQQDRQVRRTAPTTAQPPVPASDTAPGAAAVASSRLARSLGVGGALAMFLALCIVPWVTTADSDSRTWYSFFQIMTYPEHGAAEVSGWVIGLVVCAVVAAIILVLLASQLTTVASGTRISAVVGSVLIAALGFAVAHGFTNGDEALHTSAGPWLFAVGAVLVSLVLLRPGIGAGRPSGSDAGSTA